MSITLKVLSDEWNSLGVPVNLKPVFDHDL